MVWPEARFRPRPHREDNKRDPFQHGEPPSSSRTMGCRRRGAAEWDAPTLLRPLSIVKLETSGRFRCDLAVRPTTRK